MRGQMSRNLQIPFRIEKSMLEEKEGKQYIKYTDEVEFSLSQSQGVRDRDIKEATDIRFIGDEWKYQERIIENNAIQNIRKKLSEYNFYYPVLADKEFVDWLSTKNVGILIAGNIYLQRNHKNASRKAY